MENVCRKSLPIKTLAIQQVSIRIISKKKKMNIATYLLEKNRKLHKKIDLHGYPDYCENVILEPSRFRSLKSPTVVLTGTCENSAGRNSVERYCLATGFKVSMTSLLPHTAAQPTKWRFSPNNLSQLVISFDWTCVHLIMS